MKNLFANVCLLLVSCVTGLVLCEVSLRLFYPKYRHLAEPQFRQDARRIYSRKPNVRSWAPHPDSGLPHSFHHNNLALRQHRNFTEADLASATNIGVFGDSFVENVGMAAPYSFTEPLDYLLNQRGEHVNVLNFGVHGYGTDQSFLYYEGFRHAADLDHVVYVYCTNDLEGLYENGLFDLDDAGRLVENRAIPSSGWVRLISRWHLSYLLLDGSGRFSSFNWGTRDKRQRAEDIGKRIRTEPILSLSGRNREEYTLAVFRQVIRRWTHLVEHNGSTFSVVLLPNKPPQASVVDLLNAESVEVVDLFDCFTGYDAAHSQRRWRHSPYRFKNDSHWNEAGNRLAAVCLYRVFEEKMRLPALSEDLRATLHGYYAAFEGWMPTNAGERGARKLGLSAATTDIRERYDALSTLTSMREYIGKWIATPGARILASDFDVYLNGRQLIYVKEGCRHTDLQNPIFLNIVPADETDLPRNRIPYGYVSYNPYRGGIDQDRCLATINLPDYRIRYLWTGQVGWGEGVIWESTFAIAPDISGERRKESYRRRAKRMIASDFDIYLDGRYLVYVKEGCRLSDWKPFFLHIIPVDKDTLPPDRVQYGFDNLDFHYLGAQSRHFGCRIMRRLPDYAIRRVRTGQYVKDDQGNPAALWEGEFHIAQGAGVEEGGP